MRPPFDHVPVNQSFVLKCNCVFIFVPSTLTSILTSFTSHAIAMYFHNNKTECSFPFLMHAFRQPKSFQNQKPNKNKRHGSKLIGIQQENNVFQTSN